MQDKTGCVGRIIVQDNTGWYRQDNIYGWV